MVNTKSKRNDLGQLEVAGDSVREPATDTASVLDTQAGTIEGTLIVADQVNEFGEMFTPEAVQGLVKKESSVPTQADVAESAVPAVGIDPGVYPETVVVFDEAASVPGPDPQVAPTEDKHPAVYLPRGARMTPALAEAFMASYRKQINDVAEAVAERLLVTLPEGATVTITPITANALLSWRRGMPYHRGHTEDYFLVATVTHQEPSGRLLSVPIHFHWESGVFEVSAHNLGGF